MNISEISILVTLFFLVNAMCIGLLFIRLKRDIVKKALKSHDKCVEYISKIEKRMAKPFTEFSGSGKNWAVITTINRKEHLKRTIDSIIKHEPQVHILVVDNGSTDGTYEYLIDTLNRGDIDKVLFNRENTIPQWQKAFSMTQALKLLSIEEVSYITHLDDDIEITKPWVNDAINIMRSLTDKNVKLINLLVDDIQERVHPTLETVAVGDIDVRIKQSFNGAFFFVTASIYKEIGLPPIGEGTGDASAEDWYYSRRFQANDWKVAVVDYSKHLGYKTSVRTSL